MKIIKYPLITLALILVIMSCNSESDKLVGLWRISKIYTFETYQGEKAGAEDRELQEQYIPGSLELRKDKTATFKNSQTSNEFTWKMNNETLELYKNSKTTPDVILFPAVKGAGLIYMKGIDAILAKIVFAESNTGFIINLEK